MKATTIMLMSYDTHAPPKEGKAHNCQKALWRARSSDQHCTTTTNHLLPYIDRTTIAVQKVFSFWYDIVKSLWQDSMFTLERFYPQSQYNHVA